MKKQKMIKLEEWAEDIINYCSPIARKQNLEYYPLQSPLNTDNTDILIVGINPRSNGNYESQCINDAWEFVDGKMKSERLLKGNPYFDLNDTSWRFFRNLKQIDFLKEVIENNKYTYMNYFYFTTSNTNEMRRISGFKDIVAFSKKILANLVDIINPRLIIILGVSDGLDIISDIPVKSVLQKGSHRILTVGAIKDIKIYGIPHSSRNYAYGVRDILSKSLKYIFENEPQKMVSKDMLRKELAEDIQNLQEIKSNPSKEENKEIVKLCVKELEKKWAFHEEKNNRFTIAGGHLSLTITSTGDGYIGIRYMDKDKIENDRIQSETIEVLDKFDYKALLKEKKDGVIWLGVKKYKDFEGSNPKEISENIISELNEIIAELEKIYQ